MTVGEAAEQEAGPASVEPQEDLDSEALARASDRIERLLGELRATTAPAAWARVQELVTSLTTIYGRGLERTLEIFAASGDGRGIDERTRGTLGDDPLVGSLLLLHGLHPAPIEERVARAVNRVRRALGHSGGEIEVSPIDAAGCLRLRICGDWQASPIPAAGVEAALRRAVEEAAPDLVELVIAREGAFPQAHAGLVQIDLARSRRSAGEAAP
jgi:hypothetical protein